jgi:pyruvate dehydrogenase E1 component beta subunit
MSTNRQLTMRQALNEALAIAMRADPTVILLGEDIAGGAGAAGLGDQDVWGGAFGVTKGLAPEFGRRRVKDTPLSETAFIGAAVGAATAGLRPVVELMFVDFFGVCADQIFNQAAKLHYMTGGALRAPLVLRTSFGTGMAAAAQHSGCYYSLFTAVAGLKVVAPATPGDAKGLLLAAIRDDGPVVFFEHHMLYDVVGEVPEGDYETPLGTATVRRLGNDVTIVATARMVYRALEAAEALAAEGVEAEVVDVRCIAPLDTGTIIASARRTGRVVVVDEDSPRCSLATDIAALVSREAFAEMRAPVALVTPPYTPVPFSPVLEDEYTPDARRVAAAVRTLL